MTVPFAGASASSNNAKDNIKLRQFYIKIYRRKKEREKERHRGVSTGLSFTCNHCVAFNSRCRFARNHEEERRDYEQLVPIAVGTAYRGITCSIYEIERKLKPEGDR